MAVTGRIYFVYSLCHVSIFGFFYAGWVFFSFLFKCRVGMLRAHFTDPKLYVLLHVLSCSIINCYLLLFLILILFYFSTSSHQPLPRVSPSSCCIRLIEENLLLINTVLKIPLTRRSGGTESAIILLLLQFVIIK